MARKTDAERLDELRRKKAQLAAKESALLARQKIEARKVETRQKIIIGGAVMAWLRGNPDKLELLRPVLDSAAARKEDKDALAVFLKEFDGSPVADRPPVDMPLPAEQAGEQTGEP